MLALSTGAIPAAQAPAAVPDAKFARSASWDAHWIEAPQSDPGGVGVYGFRKTFSLAKKPERFVVNITADNGYRLFVNGEPVASGPAKGSPNRWYYDTLDIADFLKEGDNTLLAEVWNFGVDAPAAQTSVRTAFLLQGNSSAETPANTGKGWKTLRNEGRSPISSRGVQNRLAGGMEQIDGEKFPWDWAMPGYDDSHWSPAAELYAPTAKGDSDYGTVEWALVPRGIPLLAERPLPAAKIRRVSAISPEAARNLEAERPLAIPARTRCTLLLEQSALTSAYVEWTFSKGAGARVEVSYAENLWDASGQKGNRNDIAGKSVAQAPRDIFLPEGGTQRRYRPLDFRTYRFIQLDIETADAPLIIESVRALQTGYPFAETGKFASDDPSLDAIWETGRRTARLCARDIYFDCPFYERLQYAGDARIQALVSLYMAGDDRLMRKAIVDFDVSRGDEGLPRSRAPSRRVQYIPPFALYWINMVEDFRTFRDDPDFLRARLDGIRSILQWYAPQVDPDSGLLRPDGPYWNFVDWVPEWPRGVPPQTPTSGSALISLQLAMALDDAANIVRSLGLEAEADGYRARANALKQNVYDKCWNPARGLLRDAANLEAYSQHTNALGILSGAIPQKDWRAVAQTMIAPDGEKLSKASLYYSFYIARALKKAGLGDRYADSLGRWQTLLDKGLTTFPETEDPSRSECHGWSASPVCELLATVCGVEPDIPGFKRVKIEPHMGRLGKIEGTVPHPDGPIKVSLRREGASLRGNVELPPNLEGVFLHAGQTYPLYGGHNEIDVK